MPWHWVCLASLKHKDKRQTPLLRTIKKYKGYTPHLPSMNSDNNLLTKVNICEESKNSIAVHNTSFGIKQIWVWISYLPLNSSVASESHLLSGKESYLLSSKLILRNCWETQINCLMILSFKEDNLVILSPEEVSLPRFKFRLKKLGVLTCIKLYSWNECSLLYVNDSLMKLKKTNRLEIRIKQFVGCQLASQWQ